MALMSEEKNKENKSNNVEEQKQGDTETSTSENKLSKRQQLEAQLDAGAKRQPQLLTRSGSDPQFDNLEYMAKIERQTLDMIKAQGIEVDEASLKK